MSFFIKDSIIYKLFYNLIILPFRNSFTKSSFLALRNIFKASFTYSLFSKYINKEPYFLHSLSYKLFRKIIKFFDKIMNLLHKIFKRIIESSKIYYFLRDWSNFSLSKKQSIFCLCVAGISFGYVLGLIVFNKTNVLIITLVTIINLSNYLIFSNVEYIKNSIVFKFFKYLFS